VLELVLIEPGVYWRVFSLDYQAEQFEVFHRSALTRWTHYVGTQLIVWGLLLVTFGHHVGPVPAPLVAAALLTGWYVRLDAAVGLVAGLQVGLLTLLAWVASENGLTALHAGAVLLVVAAAQNVSHSVEPVPPVLTGRGFESFPVFWAKASGWHRARLLLLNVCYLPLELVSAPRLFAVHVLRAMHRLGWRSAWAADVRARARGILGEA
jgi:uncharacterized membrane protein (UPF0136 family)